LRKARKTPDAELSKRFLIIVLLSEGKSSVIIEHHLKVARAHVSRTARRYQAHGEAGLQDRREENGSRKTDERFLKTLREIVESPPESCGWHRSTWSRELLTIEMAQRTGIAVSRSTLGRCLRVVGARWSRARAIVLCPWRTARRQRRLRDIRSLVARLGPEEEGFYVDEVDIDLNPRIGPDWMLRRQQKRILTPGTNQTAYLAGALNARTGHIVWAEGDQKRSWLFLNLLRILLRCYQRARRVHIILDNYIIHKSRIVQAALATWGHRVRLHFLPPYCPDHNRIELLWLQLHSNVTRNHRCRTLSQLLDNVRYFLKCASPFPGNRPSMALSPND
jgi:transposase